MSEAIDKLTLGDLVNFKRGYDLPHRDREKGIVPIISSSGLTGWHKKSMAKAPGVVTGRYGTLGEVFYIEEDYWPLNTSLYVQDFKGNNPRFIYYYLKTVLNENFNSAGAVPGVNRNYLHKIKVPLVPKDQKKIAAILSAYDDLIENNKRRIALLENMAEEIYREWFVRFRFPGYQTAEFEKGIPKGWDVRRVGDLYKTSSGGTPSRKNLNNYDGNINWLKTGELKNKFVFGSEEKITLQGLESSSAKIFPENTVVIAMYCAMPDITILAEPSSTNQACCAFLPKYDYLSHIYTYYLIKFAQQHMIQYAHGAAQQNLSQDLIKGFSLLSADKLIVESFTKTIDPIFLKIQALMKVTENLNITKNMLLPRLISGKLSVENLDIQFPPSMQQDAS